MIRKRTKENNLALIVRYFKSNDISRSGRNLFGIVYSEKESATSKLLIYSRTEAVITGDGLKPIESFSSTGSRQYFKVE